VRSSTRIRAFVDPAYLEREYDARLDYTKIASLVARKFEAEKGERRYRELGVDSLASPRKQARAAGETLPDVDNVRLKETPCHHAPRRDL
jgi:hypothetical protein